MSDLQQQTVSEVLRPRQPLDERRWRRPELQDQGWRDCSNDSQPRRAKDIVASGIAKPESS